VVDDEADIRGALSSLLAADFDVTTADSAERAQEVFAQRPIDLILTDQRMPSVTGVQLLEWVRQNYPKTIRLLMTGYAEIDEAVQAINRGQVFRYLSKPWHTGELLHVLHQAGRTFHLEQSHERLLGELRQLNLELEERVQQRTRELEEANHELLQKNKMLEKLALTDPLTGLPNRRAMDRLAERELRRRDRYPGAVALGLIDVDHFKRINEHYLLPGGDHVLVEMGKSLSTSLRTVDFLGRIGGEEFLVVAPETNLGGAATLGERIRSSVEQHPFRYKESVIQVTVSIGMAVAETGVVAEYDQMKHVAAAALAEAKVTGRNRCVLHSLSPRPIEQAG
jgi:diguanylate cyclase (GGDEF)-like protein